MKRVLAALALFSLAGGSVALAESKPPAQASGKETSADERRFFTEDAAAPMIKPPGYNVTIVEYMDYQCPYCRASHGPLKQLVANDKKIRVIFRDWPIFGPASQSAAMAAIASKYQGKYVAMHDALMEMPLPLNDDKIKAAAKKAGVDWARLQKDKVAHSEEIEDLFQRNDKQAQLLGLDGTPGFIIGNVQSFGGMNLAQFKKAVARARREAPRKVR